jgi:hypothetical protein
VSVLEVAVKQWITETNFHGNLMLLSPQATCKQTGSQPLHQYKDLRVMDGGQFVRMIDYFMLVTKLGLLHSILEDTPLNRPYILITYPGLQPDTCKTHIYLV